MQRTSHLKLLTLLAVLTITVALAGCASDDSPTAPIAPTDQAPILPDPGLVTFDFSFFEQGSDIEANKSLDEYENFLNAYLRVALLEVIARIVMTPPVAAFSLALHTPPSLQDDGSWIWVYTFVDGDEEAQIRLRGLPLNNGVEWELRVTLAGREPELDNEIWFTGTTSDDGETGTWTFRDLDDPAFPISGEIAWGDNAAGRFLRFTSLGGDDVGDTLEFQDADPRYTITYMDADLDETLHIEWFADGHGNLTVPDFNDGEQACWDTDLRNVVCQ